jgi:hypothetical protein
MENPPMTPAVDDARDSDPSLPSFSERGARPHPDPAVAPPLAPVPAAAYASRPLDPRVKSPALATVLSLVPGLGQVYVGYYQRGFVHAVVVAVLFAVLLGDPSEALVGLLVFLLVFFWLYNVIDAGRRAALYNFALAGGTDIELPRDFALPTVRGSLAGGLLFMAVGVVALLNTRFGVSLEWIEEWWPAGLIGLGGYLLVRAIADRRSLRESR